MMGNTLESNRIRENSSRGLQPRILDKLFEEICKKKDDDPELDYLVKASYFEIYNEQIKDLVSIKTLCTITISTLFLLQMRKF